MNVRNMFDLTGKTAFVTGGAGSYGRQITKALAEAGATTFIASRNIVSLRSAAEEFQQAGQDVRPIELDLATEASILSAREFILSTVGHLDILVNNAVSRPALLGMEEPAENWNDSFKVNATGFLLVTRAMGEIIRDGGSIINVGSIMALVGPEPENYSGTNMQGWYPDYYFHKGGMASVTRFFASFYGNRGIRCNCLHPGGLLTNQPREFIENYSKRTCLGRLATDDDLAGAIVFLASDASRYVTGVNLAVDGGYSAK